MPVFLFFLVVIGSYIGYETTLMTQFIIAIIVGFLLSTAKGDAFGNMILTALALYVAIGLAIGNFIYFINPNLTRDIDYSSLNPESRIIKEQTSNLPELICNSNNNIFIIKEYKEIENEQLINIKTDQVFYKKDCSLK